ncbi:Uu.00g056060.m01.CDS01 [Anthostomella pinea]|uniref:Uu.00g056060.m01.CDS01 n=1 Tax=Anthostomella pinea TaxID=933095 RepID=A0AAI8YPV9_9PEZI|nr:Uu.00g056060.m01.CDS01 [Anthostomella pinea]
MRHALVLGGAALASAAYTPRQADFSATLNPRSAQPKHPGFKRDAASTPSVNISSVEQLVYDIDVELGNQQVKLLVDSGSFSLWTATPDYRCTDGYWNYTTTTCGIVGTYDPTSDPDAVEYDGTAVTYYESYGSGYAQGAAYNTTVTIGGFTVENYPIGYADAVDFSGGDNEVTGIIGLGLGEATGFYLSDPWTAQAPAGLFQRLKEQLGAWQFAITYGEGISNGPSSTSNTGTLSLGGIATGMYPGDVDTAEFVTLNISADFKKEGYSYWGGNIDGWTYPNDTASGYATPFATDVLVDSGTAYMKVDRGTTGLYNALWTGGSTVSGDYYVIDCNATAPDFSVIIAGETRNISSHDLVYRLADGTCQSSITEAINSPQFILGAPFFKSNLVVFDGDAEAIHVAQKPRAA